MSFYLRAVRVSFRWAFALQYGPERSVRRPDLTRDSPPGASLPDGNWSCIVAEGEALCECVIVCHRLDGIRECAAISQLFFRQI